MHYGCISEREPCARPSLGHGGSLNGIRCTIQAATSALAVVGWKPRPLSSNQLFACSTHVSLSTLVIWTISAPREKQVGECSPKWLVGLVVGGGQCRISSSDQPIQARKFPGEGRSFTCGQSICHRLADHRSSASDPLSTLSTIETIGVNPLF